MWQLYSAIPGLLTYQTSAVAQRLHGLSYATGWRMQQLVNELCGFRRLAFLHPNAVEVRVGMLARLTRLDRKMRESTRTLATVSAKTTHRCQLMITSSHRHIVILAKEHALQNRWLASDAVDTVHSRCCCC